MYPTIRHTHNYIVAAVVLALLDAQDSGQLVLCKQA